MSPALVEIWNPAETDCDAQSGYGVHCVTTARTADYSADPMLCHCLQVRASTVQAAVADGGICTLRQLARATGAGDGCTACHRRLKKFLEATRVPAPVAAESAPATIAAAAQPAAA